jgi:endo-1,4-beta-xylanase
MIQKYVYIITLISTCFLATGAIKAQQPTRHAIPSLKETFKNDFLIGAALNTQQIMEQNADAARLVPLQFNAITPENIMKAAFIHPEWDKYNFTLADKLIALSEKYHCKVNAHTLIWHSQLPAFVRNIKNADSLRHYMINHITTVAGRYKNKVFSWDVVNEALSEDGSLRKSIFLKLLGEDYIIEAFRLARQAAPDAALYYNDYNIENPKKRAGAITLIKKIQAAGIRIDGVGIQGHWRAGHVPLADIEKSIQEYSALGIKVMFTELDLSVLPNPWRGDNADVSAARVNNSQSMNPYPNGLPDSLQALLSTAYADLFHLFLKYKDKIGRITFWGVNDGQSWLNNFPVRGRTNYPLLFDRAFEPKPAFYSVIATRKKNDKRKS